MASNITVSATVTDASTTVGDVRAELRTITDGDLTEKSPVTAGIGEAGVTIDESDSGLHLNLRVEGHEGEWSKTSMDAVTRAVGRVGGVEDVTVTDGGYESE